MNLWDRLAGLCAVAIIMWGCKDDEATFLGFRNIDSKFKVTYTEIEVPSAVILIDSVRTYNDPAMLLQERRTLIGRYSDPLFGEINAEMYTQFRPTNHTVDIPSEARFVSAFFNLSLDYRFYGTNDVSTVNFAIYELTDSILTAIDRDLLPNNVRRLPNYLPYYANTSISYDPTPLGQAAYEVDPVTFNEFRELLDYVQGDVEIKDLDALSIKLDGTYGKKLFDAARAQNITYTRFPLFKRTFLGFAIVAESGNKILSFDPDNDTINFSKSKLIINYDEFDEDLQDDIRKTLEYTFYKFDDNNFHTNFSKITADRTGTSLSSLVQPNVEFEPTDNMRYYQSGNPVTTIVNFGKFLEFTDTISNVIFNSVEFSIEVEDFDTFEPPAMLRLRLLNENNDFLNFFSQNKEESNTPVFAASMTYDEEGWFIIGQRLNSVEVSNLFDIEYDAETHTYRGDLTDFFQTLTAVDNEEQLFTRFALVASDPPMGLSVNRTVFKKENIKLKVTFTTPTSDNK